MHDPPSATASALRRAAFALAAIGFVSSALVHLASFFGIAIDRPSVLVLHVGAMALAAPLVFTTTPPGRWWRRGERWRTKILANAPPWGERALHLAFLNFLAHFGALVLLARGKAPADPALRPHVVRMFSAGWMTVYLLCALAWWPLGRSRSGEDRSRSVG